MTIVIFVAIVGTSPALRSDPSRQFSESDPFTLHQESCPNDLPGGPHDQDRGQQREHHRERAQGVRDCPRRRRLPPSLSAQGDLP